MKLKYYLRGLGIGMIVTALILGISFSNRQEQTAQGMTDDQIRECAAELGMVDSSELTLAALQNGAKQPTENATEDPVETQGQKETTEVAETTADLQETQTTAETATAPENTAEPETTIAPENTAEPDQELDTGITIQRGDDSGSVSRKLYEAGLVENAKAFDNYLCHNGYSRSINPGTYEIEPGTSEEEIAKIITGKQ